MTGSTVPSSEGENRFQVVRKLTEICRALTYATDLDDALRLATSRAAEILGAESALLMIMDDDGLLRIRATQGVEDELIQQFREPLDETLPRRLQGLLGVRAQEDFLGVPLVTNGAVTGLLAVVRPGAAAGSEEDEWMLTAVADQAAVALENAEMAREIERMRAERSRSKREQGVEEVKDRALATLSHDLRSPLNAISAYAELMEMEILGPIVDRQREALGRIRMSGRHLLAILDDVLEMARLDAGVVKVKPAPVGAGTVVQEALHLVDHDAAARGHRLKLSDGEVIVMADPDRLRQVLVNLIGNAIKYTPTGGNITVEVDVGAAEGARWGVVEVADDGPGIPAEKLEQIFEPYVRGGGLDEDSDGKGAGLGLAISRELVRKMGGEIEVRSEVGAGSTFTVRLPLTEPSD